MLLMFSISFLFRTQLYTFFHIPFKYFLGVLFLIIPVAIRALLSQLLRAQLKSIAYTIATILNQFATIGLAVFFAKFLQPIVLNDTLFLCDGLPPSTKYLPEEVL